MLNLASHSTGRTADVIWFGSRPVADHDGDNSLLHELLHWFGVKDLTAQQHVILKSCYPNSEP